VRLIGIDPNPHLRPYLEQAARSAGMTLDVRQGKAERLPPEAGSADAVGCYPDRKTLRTVRPAGFARGEAEFLAPTGFVAPHISGVAENAA
jgi:hypothetical protein